MKYLLFAVILFFTNVSAQDTTAVDQAAPAVEQAAPAVEAAQASEAVVTEESTEEEKPFALSLSVGRGNVWRGQPLGLPDHVCVQPSFSYQVTPELSVGGWMTTAFHNNNPTQGYDEFDVYASYTVNDMITLGVSSYYFPALELADGETNPSWTDFSGAGKQTLDATVTLDLSSKFNQPITILWSTFLGGADVDDEDVRQYTSYAEATYSFENENMGISGSATVGAIVFGNKSAYYSFAKEGFNLINIGGKVSKDVTSMVPFMENISKSMWVSFTFNPQISDENETTTYYGASDESKIGAALISAGMQFDF